MRGPGWVCLETHGESPPCLTSPRDIWSSRSLGCIKCLVKRSGQAKSNTAVRPRYNSAIAAKSIAFILRWLLYRHKQQKWRVCCYNAKAKVSLVYVYCNHFSHDIRQSRLRFSTVVLHTKANISHTGSHSFLIKYDFFLKCDAQLTAGHGPPVAAFLDARIL